MRQGQGEGQEKEREETGQGCTALTRQIITYSPGESRMSITTQQLLQILPNASSRAGVFVPVLNVAMSKYAIVTRLRIAAFLAQVGHESGQLRYVRELGSDQYLDKYDTGRLAERLGNTPEDDDDGQLYRGRGLIQVTGRDNYTACAEALGLDLLEHPELLELPEHAAMSAAWFWHCAGLNTLADKGEFLAITKRINGGTNGQADRQMLYERALKVLP
ncbi:Glycoside hydrolase [Pseudomonas savastanoi pv. savastanoi]|nr:Glycoside hydrolase [Pseudomonas savastanoi pv. retacarpa]RMN67256.1 Glycoside hydrolase [Pseudomonas savastanoi pv. savastanoi]